MKKMRAKRKRRKWRRESACANSEWKKEREREVIGGRGGGGRMRCCITRKALSRSISEERERERRGERERREETRLMDQQSFPPKKGKRDREKKKQKRDASCAAFMTQQHTWMGRLFRCLSLRKKCVFCRETASISHGLTVKMRGEGGVGSPLCLWGGGKKVALLFVLEGVGRRRGNTCGGGVGSFPVLRHLAKFCQTGLFR